jgi:type IV pilus assembly protein PilC
MKTRKFPIHEQAAFCNQLSALLQAGVSLSRALTVLALQASREDVKKTIEVIRQEVQAGKGFAAAVASIGEVFDPLVTVTVEVGENTGRLGQVLGQLGEYFERVGALRRKTIQAMTYPALVLSVAVLAVLFLLLFIVPAFADMFRGFQIELPTSTRAVLGISELLSEYGLWIAGSLLAVALISRRLVLSDTFKVRLLAIYSKIPGVGRMHLNVLIARFCRTLGTLLQARVSLIEALDLTRRIFTFPQIRSEIDGLSHRLKQGKGLGEEVAASAWFPPMVAQMIMVGEETSELDVMLLKVASHYEKEVSDSVETLTSVIEPVIVLFLGIVVALLLVTMYLPMFELVNLSAVN